MRMTERVLGTIQGEWSPNISQRIRVACVKRLSLLFVSIVQNSKKSIALCAKRESSHAEYSIVFIRGHVRFDHWEKLGSTSRHGTPWSTASHTDDERCALFIHDSPSYSALGSSNVTARVFAGKVQTIRLIRAWRAHSGPFGGRFQFFI